MSDYQQTDSAGALGVPNGACFASNRSPNSYSMQVGGAAGTISNSAGILSGGTIQNLLFFSAPLGDPGTTTWVGACTMRFDVTTANTNITWGQMCWLDRETVGGNITLTATSGLAIGLGTTGVKTASVEATSAYTPSLTANTQCIIIINVSNSAAMNATFNWVNDQLITMPFTSSAAPVTQPFTLGQMKVGI